MPVYEAREDSELLRSHVEKIAQGSTLDMGTGTGVQAVTAARKDGVPTVLAVDVDEESLDAAQAVVAREPPAVRAKIHLVQSDLFTDIKEKFDTIIFNPPYLPAEKKDEHQALYGGKAGYELTLRFLDEAQEHLNEGGNVIIIVSSLSNQEHLLLEARKLGYHYKLLGEEASFFERIGCYRLWRS